MINFNGVKQKEKMDCAAACLCTISKFYKKNISLEFTKEMMKTDQFGASVYGIIETANKIGFRAFSVITSTFFPKTLSNANCKSI